MDWMISQNPYSVHYYPGPTCTSYGPMFGWGWYVVVDITINYADPFGNPQSKVVQAVHVWGQSGFSGCRDGWMKDTWKTTKRNTAVKRKLTELGIKDAAISSEGKCVMISANYTILTGLTYSLQNMIWPLEKIGRFKKRSQDLFLQAPNTADGKRQEHAMVAVAPEWYTAPWMLGLVTLLLRGCTIAGKQSVRRNLAAISSLNSRDSAKLHALREAHPNILNMLMKHWRKYDIRRPWDVASPNVHAGPLQLTSKLREWAYGIARNRLTVRSLLATRPRSWESEHALKIFPHISDQLIKYHQAKLRR